MLLDPWPAVYCRLHNLIKYSDEFKSTARGCVTHLRDIEDKKLLNAEEKKIVSEIDNKFFISTSDEERAIAEKEILDVVYDLDLYIENEFGHDTLPPSKNMKIKFEWLYHSKWKLDISISIRAPITKKEYMDYWIEMPFEMKYFLQWWAVKWDVEMAGEVYDLLIKSGRWKNRKIDMLWGKESELAKEWKKLPKKEQEELDAFHKNLQDREFFFENPKEQLDQDLEILRVSRQYPKFKEGLEHYEKMMILKWAKENWVDIVEKPGHTTFSELAIKYLPNDIKTLSDTDAIKRRIWIKNYKQRLEEIKKAMYLP